MSRDAHRALRPPAAVVMRAVDVPLAIARSVPTRLPVTPLTAWALYDTVSRDLEHLAGEHEDDVADRLAAAGVRGLVDDWMHPVSRWVAGLYPALDVRLSTHYVRVSWYPAAPGAPTVSADVPLPESVREFARLFDSGRYPRLLLGMDAPHTEPVPHVETGTDPWLPEVLVDGDAVEQDAVDEDPGDPPPTPAEPATALDDTAVIPVIDPDQLPARGS